ESLLQPVNLLVAAGEHATGSRMLRNLGIEALRHLGEVVLHAWTKISEQDGVVSPKVEVPLHLLNEGFVTRLGLERSRHRQDFIITRPFRVKGGVVSSNRLRDCCRG